ncbi:MAG: hypothetical protein R3C61_11975 [Bacteroidia bacterium]
MAKRKLNLRASSSLSLRTKIIAGVVAGGLILAGIYSTLSTQGTTEEASAFGTMVLKGNAVKNSDDSFTLTNNSYYQTGAAWFQERISLGHSFILEMDINFGTSDGGADGIAFVFHNAASGTNTIGSTGEKLCRYFSVPYH